MTPHDNIHDLIQVATTAHLLQFQYALIETIYGLEQQFNVVNTTSQRHIEEILAQFKRHCTTPPNEQDVARFEQAYPMSHDTSPSYQMGTYLIYNWESDESPMEIACELHSLFVIACHDLWRARDAELTSKVDVENIDMCCEHWIVNHLKHLIEQNATDSPAPSLELPHAEWRRLINHQRTYPPKQRTQYVAQIRDIDTTHHWQCDIPELNMINVVVRGPQHILKITKDPNWYHQYDDPHMDWYDLLKWKAALVRVIDPNATGLFEMVEEAITRTQQQ